MQEEDKQRRKNEIIAEYEAKMAARKEKKAAKLVQEDDNGTKYITVCYELMLFHARWQQCYYTCTPMIK